MLKKILLVALAICLFSVPAYAGNRPEFDAVACDATNYFNDAVKDSVVANAVDGFGNQINLYSDFTGILNPRFPELGVLEEYTQTAGQEFPDPCFPGYLSSLTDIVNQATYTWRILLQMKPESDIDLNIRDCVMKHNEFDVWTGAEQTGRYRAPSGQLFFIPAANPLVTVQAIPGEFATPGFVTPFFMDFRTQPGLFLLPGVNQPYTSKALWDEALVLVLPATGATNLLGQATYNLKQGDQIQVDIAIPPLNTTDIRYGQDNVVLKYIGIVGTDYLAAAMCM